MFKSPLSVHYSCLFLGKSLKLKGRYFLILVIIQTLVRRSDWTAALAQWFVLKVLANEIVESNLNWSFNFIFNKVFSPCAPGEQQVLVVTLTWGVGGQERVRELSSQVSRSPCSSAVPLPHPPTFLDTVYPSALLDILNHYLFPSLKPYFRIT